MDIQKKNPKVSVIVATYKRDWKLERALISLIKQTYTNIEIVVVDDNANTDWNNRVKSIIERTLGNSFMSFKYISNKENKGSAETRNIGILNSQGSYITFLDDDDLYLPDKIKNQLAHMLQKKSDFSVTDMYLYNDEDKLIEHRSREYLNKAKDSKTLMKLHFIHHITGPDSMMFKKNYLIKIGMFAPINVGDDFYLIKRAIEGNGSFSYLQRCDLKAYVQISDIGLSSGKSKINGENELYEYKKKYIHLFTAEERKYIRMRHYAVLAFAELRRRNYHFFLKEAILSFLSSPIDALNLFFEKTKVLLTRNQ